MNPRVNYDEIAHLYDEPLRDHAPDPNLATFIEESGIAPARACILDVGCGTGKQLAANWKEYDALTMVGLDRFAGMLHIAARRCPGACWVQGHGAALPFAGSAFDYITSQYCYQHIRDTEGLIREVFRVLRPRGRFVMNNIDPWSMKNWIVYRYFPAARDLDFRDFMPVERFERLMRSIGFSNVRFERTTHTQQEDLKSFLEYASDRHRASQFLAISEQAYRDGISRLEEEARGPGTGIESEFVFVTVRGDKPAA